MQEDRIIIKKHKKRMFVLGLTGAFIAGSLLTGQINGLRKKEPTVEQKVQSIYPQTIHEYFDLNRDGNYEYHRVVMEENGQVTKIFGTSYGNEISKELIESGPLIGNSRRFFTL